MLWQDAIDQGATLTLDACVIAVDASGNKVTLADGSVHEADVVVGADGEFQLRYKRIECA